MEWVDMESPKITAKPPMYSPVQELRLCFHLGGAGMSPGTNGGATLIQSLLVGCAASASRNAVPAEPDET